MFTKKNRGRFLSLFLASYLTIPSPLLATPSSVTQPHKPKLLPAIPGEVDTSNTSPFSPLPAYSSTTSRIASLLKQAMNKYNQGDTRGAELLFHKVLTIDFRNSDALYNLGVIAESNGDLQTALKDYQIAASSNPIDPEIAQAVNQIELKLKQQPSLLAPKNSSSTISKNKQSKLKSIADEAALAYRKGNFTLAIKDLENLSKDDPADANVQYALGQAYRAQGNNNQARQHFQQATALAPDNQEFKSTLESLNSLPQPSSQGSSSSQSQSTANSSNQMGQITPFTPDATSAGPPPYNPATGGNSLASGSGDYYGSGSNSSSSRRGSYSQGCTRGWRSFYNSQSGYRLRRVVVGAAMGAAMGGLMSRAFGGRFSRGAIYGGAMGGLGGLLWSRW